MQDETSSKQQNNSTNWSKNNLGSLWLKTGKNNKYLSGKISLQGPNGEIITQNIIVFKNKYKEKDNQPDYLIFQPFEN
jgi:hypothetical protein